MANSQRKRHARPTLARFWMPAATAEALAQFAQLESRIPQGGGAPAGQRVIVLLHGERNVEGVEAMGGLFTHKVSAPRAWRRGFRRE